MTLLNIVYALKCDSNLISLEQFYDSEISYRNHPDSMILKQRGNIFKIANKHKNFFDLKTNFKAKAMLMREKD